MPHDVNRFLESGVERDYIGEPGTSPAGSVSHNPGVIKLNTDEHGTSGLKSGTQALLHYQRYKTWYNYHHTRKSKWQQTPKTPKCVWQIALASTTILCATLLSKYRGTPTHATGQEKSTIRGRRSTLSSYPHTRPNEVIIFISYPQAIKYATIPEPADTKDVLSTPEISSEIEKAQDLSRAPQVPLLEDVDMENPMGWRWHNQHALIQRVQHLETQLQEYPESIEVCTSVEPESTHDTGGAGVLLSKLTPGVTRKRFRPVKSYSLSISLRSSSIRKQLLGLSAKKEPKWLFILSKSTIVGPPGALKESMKACRGLNALRNQRTGSRYLNGPREKQRQYERPAFRLQKVNSLQNEVVPLVPPIENRLPEVDSYLPRRNIGIMPCVT
ncbi:hypothetical protein L218DRAFT_942768 [Marasmius fiardii PR-910]|nr:hypothetical protein L218DRAFT_942768 [Marasmius fiardii PR-910]